MASRRGRAAAVRAPNGNSRAAGKAHERPRDKHATDTAKQLQRAQREHRKEGKQGRAQAVGVVRRLTRGERKDRKSVVSGKSVSVRVDLGGRRIIKKKIKVEEDQHKIN